MDVDSKCKCGHTFAVHPKGGKCEASDACDCTKFAEVKPAAPAGKIVPEPANE